MATAPAATQGGEEAGAKAARLRTETSYKAGGAGEWAQHLTSTMIYLHVTTVGEEAAIAKIHSLMKQDPSTVSRLRSKKS